MFICLNDQIKIIIKIQLLNNKFINNYLYLNNSRKVHITEIKANLQFYMINI